SFNLQVFRLSHVKSATRLGGGDARDPVSTILRAYYELVLDVSSATHIDSPLSRCFNLVFIAFQRTGQDKFDTIMARYFAETQSRDYFSDTIEHLRNLNNMPGTEDKVKTYFDNELTSLKKILKDNDNKRLA
ncbi:unnamed protein product, partial [Didymodactylos carnosus]